LVAHPGAPFAVSVVESGIMEEHAYVELHQLEQNHWWYRGVRSIYRILLRRYVSDSKGRVLDVGCGTGGNLSLLTERGAVTGLDPWRPALLFCSADKLSGLVQGEAEALPFKDGAFDLVTMLGVIEHVTDDMTMLREASRVCRSGGKMLLLTSAFMFLWSHHDEANHHVRRYTSRELWRKVTRLGLRVCRISYLNCFLFPVAAVVRLVQRVLPAHEESHLDMFPLPEPFNTGLAWLLAFEGWLMQWVALPFGVSIVAVLER
jgi:SAM-dependent methyltransferase